MNIRDWLAVIVIVFIVLILLDGFRRKWLERKNRIVMKLDKNIPQVEDDEENDVLVRSELPSGGARVKPRSEDADNDVPLLMESVDLDDDEIEGYLLEESEEESDDSYSEESVEEAGEWLKEESVPEEEEDVEPEIIENSWEDAEAEEDALQKESETASGKKLFGGRGRESDEDRIEPSFGDEDLTFSHDDQGELDLEHNDLIENELDVDDDNDEQDVAEEVIIINVMARPGTLMEGSKLLPVLLHHGMRLGDMSIFHRHSDTDGHGPVMFSMANMLKPGTFTMADMETFETPGVSFFMQMPNKLGNMQCFEQMLNTAEAVKDELDAELKDENRSVFTRQTVEHSRQRISDFELEMLARK